MPMRRVLHVNDRSPDSLGGAEVLMARTCGLLNDAGWQVRTFSETDLPDRRRTACRYLSNSVACSALAKILADFRPDVVHLHNYYHLLSPAILPLLAKYKQEAGARIVMTAHDYHLVCPNSGGNWFRRGPRLVEVDRLRSWRYLLTHRWDRRGIHYSSLKLLQHVRNYRFVDRRRAIDLVLCTCQFLQELLTRIGLPARHLANPSPPVVVQRCERPAELTMVFAGRIEPEKGIRRFLEVLPADFNGRLRIVGEGADRSTCEAICTSKGIDSRVEFLGRQTHAQTIEAIASAHVVVVPSLLFETYPLVAQEALTVGTNVLVADYGGMKEIVLDAGVGFRFHPFHPETLAPQLRAIEAAHMAGTLNSFDVSAFLAGRTDADYLAGLLRAYAGEPA